MSNPAAKDATAKAAVAKVERTEDIIGTESAKIYSDKLYHETKLTK